MNRPPVLLLDVMDCLVHDPFYKEVLDFFGMSLEELFAIKSKRDWMHFEHGWLHEAAMRDAYFVGSARLELEGLRECMSLNYRLLPGIKELLEQLKEQNIEMHDLSNYPVWYRLVEERTQLSRWLKWSFVSCKTQVRKPASEAFLGAARALGRAVKDCIFVDDREKNCEGARATGMRAIHFTDAARLKLALRAEGIELD